MADAKLDPQQIAAYQAFYKVLDDASFKTSDDAAFQVLSNAAQKLSDILTGQNEISLDANTALFAAFSKDLDAGNDALSAIQDQVAAIDTRIGYGGQLIAALTKVISVL